MVTLCTSTSSFVCIAACSNLQNAACLVVIDHFWYNYNFVSACANFPFGQLMPSSWFYRDLRHQLKVLIATRVLRSDTW
jgi:hypothetical protein